MTAIKPSLGNFRLFCKALQYFRKSKMGFQRHFRTRPLLSNSLIPHQFLHHVLHIFSTLAVKKEAQSTGEGDIFKTRTENKNFNANFSEECDQILYRHFQRTLYKILIPFLLTRIFFLFLKNRLIIHSSYKYAL